MTITATCEVCGKKYRFHDKYAGRTLPCKECGIEIDVPGPRGQTRHETRRRPRQSSRSRRKRVSGWRRFRESNWFGISVGVVALLGLAWFTSYLLTPPEWRPDPALITSLQQECAVGDYAISVPKDFEFVGLVQERANSTSWMWRGPSGDLEVLLMVDPSFKTRTEPCVSNKNAATFNNDNVDPTFLLPGASIKKGKIGELAFTRILYDQTESSGQMSRTELGASNCIYIAYDADIRIEVFGKTDEAMDSRVFSMLQTAACSFRRLKPGETIEPPSVSDAVASRDRQNDIGGNTLPGGSTSPHPVTSHSPVPPTSAPRVQPRTQTPAPTSTASPPAWTDTSEPTVPLSAGGRSILTFSPVNAAYVAVDRTVYEVSTGKRIGEIRHYPEDKNVIRALSSEGHFFAVGAKMSPATAEVLVISTETGELLHTFQYAGESQPRLQFLRFASDDKLIAGFWQALIEWEISTGKERFIQTDGYFEARGTAIDNSGKYMAVVETSQLPVYDLESIKPVVTMAPPIEGNSLPFSSCKCLSFSPDTMELAALMNDSLIVWDNHGKLEMNIPLKQEFRIWSNIHQGLQWLPDKSGWFLPGCTLLDRKTGVIVWELNLETTYDSFPYRVFDQNHLLVARKRGAFGELFRMPIPWDRIRPALSQLSSNQHAVLRPGQAVTLEVSIGPILHADRDRVAKKLTDAMVLRLQNDQIALADDQPTVCRVEYSEKTGPESRVYTGSPWRSSQSNSIRTVQRTTGTLHVELKTRGAATPVWASDYSSDGGINVKGEPTEQAVRDEMFERITSHIKVIEIPRFVPNDKSVDTLPIVTEYGP